MARKPVLRSFFRRFLADERGAFAVMFGVMAIVLVALGGAVVDYVTLEQGRNRAQLALDAAALALQPRVFESDYDEAEVQRLAQAFLDERIGRNDVVATIVTTRGNGEEGSLYFQARITVPTVFVALVGVPELGAAIEAEATRKKLALEVVMVLDNSGSMASENRMTSLIDAAKCATYILMYSAVQDAGRNNNTCVPTADAELVEDVRIGIVPFTMFVNVGAGNANAAWIDKTGASSIHFDNFDNDDDEDRLVLTSGTHYFPTRQALFAATGQTWRGCVDARPHIKTGTEPSEYLDTDDTPPVAGDTLFVPQFAPDLAAGTGGNNYINNTAAIINSTYLNTIGWATANADSPAICDRPAQGATRCDIEEQRIKSNGNWGNPFLTKGTVNTGSPINFVSNAMYQNAFYGRLPPNCACRNTTSSNTITYTSWTGSGNTQTRTGYCSSFVPFGLSTRELQERTCKYHQTIGAQGFSSGPNADCTRTPILPLTNVPETVIATINSMTAEGGTNIHEGTAWGYRALTPGEPFTEGGDLDDESIKKVMIIMTDGENTDYNLSNHCNEAMRTLNGKCYNTAYGFPYNSRNPSTTSTSGGNINRLGQMNATNAQLVEQMNQRTSDTCANAKAAGIEIYTIGLATDKVSQSTTAVVQAMLKGCASATDKAEFPSASSDLKDNFTSIANELSALRLAL
ncbi:hypothetical protein ASD83_20520 [Devosia sp. Root685]|uniref:TadE/TadG family type IV pilus assembly protein n=1 Tax=Devosia sp. Root685 TaxID=1736587 RepID=UPI0006FEEF2F|nr:pilus assembly protein [Devosia sp. Root685]KRA95197.1 hypothetical protein ASD83_20520 [Devosia sp. Root685]